LPPAADWRYGALAAVQQRQQRATPARALVVDYIAALERPFTAEELVAELAERQQRSGRATVYRTLDWLRDAGWITRVQGDGEQHAYTRLMPGHHHSVVCTLCGATLILGGCDLDAVLAPILAGSGFTIEGHRLELYGTCAHCQPVAGAPR
jgi:Fur family ferric uptake transcriptional regulator